MIDLRTNGSLLSPFLRLLLSFALLSAAPAWAQTESL